MRYSPKSIANYFIDLAKASGEGVSPMKLQKLVYYAHGWYAGNTGEPLIDEAVEAWQYGPVIPSLYHEFKRFGSSVVACRATDFEGMELCEVPSPTEPKIRDFLRHIWDSYGRFTGTKLSEMTHAEGSPWDVTWKESQGLRGVDIPFERITEHFKNAVEKARKKASLQ